MWCDVRAEIDKLARRPATWLLTTVAVVLGLTFSYLVPYLGATMGTDGPPGSDRGLSATLPEHVVGNAIGGSPVFVGALALIFGVLVVGSEYAWRTWKTVLGQGPSRCAVYLAKLAAVGMWTLITTMALFSTGAAASWLIASEDGQRVDWPSAADLLTGVLAGWLVTSTWAALGVLLAICLRSVALPVGLGLIWLLAVQNLVAALAAPLIDWVAEAQHWLPGPNAGSLVASLGANQSTPGVGVLVDAGQAALVLVLYLVAFATAGGWLFSRRDIVD